MKKGISKLVFLILAFLLCAPVVSVLAEIETEDLFELGEDGELILFIGWEGSKPDVQIISPDGTVYDVFSDAEGTRRSEEDDGMYYIIENAKAGQWKARCDRTADTSLSIERVQTHPLLVMESVTVTPLGGTYYDVAFSARYGEENVSYVYSVRLIADGNASASVELASGYAAANEQTTVRIDLSRARSYESYRILVEGLYTGLGLDLSDSAVSDVFSFANPASFLPQTAFSVTLMPGSFSTAVEWEPELGAEYLIALTEENGADEPETQFESFDPQETGYCEFLYSPDAKVLTFSFSEKTGDFFSDEKKIYVDLDALPSVAFPEQEVTSSPEMRVDYSGFVSDTEVTFTDGDKKTVKTLSGSGTLYLGLSDGGFETVSAVFLISDGVRVLSEKEIFIDREPPMIYMLQDYTNAATSRETFEIAGTVYGCTELFVGSEKIAFDENGAFIHSLTLVPGENEFDVTAADAAGNTSLYRVKITRRADGAAGSGDSGTLLEKLEAKTADPTLKTLIRFSPAILAALVGTAAIVTAAASWRKKDVRGILKGLRRLFGFLGAASVSFVFYSLTGYAAKRLLASDVDFIDAALDSVERAAKMLEWERIYLTLVFVGLGSAALFGVARVTVRLIEKKKGFAEESVVKKKASRPEKDKNPKDKKKDK